MYFVSVSQACSRVGADTPASIAAHGRGPRRRRRLRRSRAAPPAERAASAPPATRTARCRSSPAMPAHGRAGDADERPADPRRRDDARAARRTSAPTSGGRGRTRCASTRQVSPGRSPTPRLCSRIRASFLLAGPLLARFGSATMPPPGGDVIGRRRLDPHIHAFAELGATIDADGQYEMRTARLRGANVFLDEASVMATENAVMAAVLAPGDTVLGNAACEPHVQDLCRFLVVARRGHRRHRVERAAHHGRREPARRRVGDRPRPHRGRELHRHGRDHGRRRHDRGRRSEGPRLDHPGVRAPRRAHRDRRDAPCACRRASSSSSETTSAG